METTFQDLNTRERDALLRLSRGGPMLNPDTEAIDHLIELGLAEQKLGGIGLSRKGHDILNRLAEIIRARRVRQN